MPDSLETMQRINRANAHAGGVAFLREDAIWEDIDTLTNALDNDDFGRELPYDNELVAQRIAGHMVKEHLKLWDIVRRRSVLNRWCPGHDDTQPESMACLYALCYGDAFGGCAFAMQSMQQLKEITDELLGGESVCQAGVNRRCSRNNATKYLAVKRGEYICLFRTCRACLQHIHSGAGVDHEDYIGPAEDWVDDREANPHDDPFA
ncbi:hypothetical protein ACK280_23935 [Mycobacterium sherrisii]|uniref:hypothetical protein n=1 Tax=Mycobacterium sherrisii TaxID=243061 RepID=UPI00397470D7